MADDFKTPQPDDWVDIEIPGGWDVLYAAGEQQPALTDERILAIAKRHRNHTLTAQSGTKFDVIEHKDVVAFAREIAREIERATLLYQAGQDRALSTEGGNA